MAASTEWSDLIWQTVTVSTRSGHSQYGVPSFGSASTYDAQWEPMPEEVRDQQGNVVEAQGTLIIMTTADISPQAKITLPDGSSPPVLSVARVPGATGTHHVEAVLGF